MPLKRMALSNYRCFADGLDVELRPLTIVLGKNNSGKSALVRAPVLCNTGINTDSPAPLDLDMLGEDFLESFTDLIYGNRPHGNIAIELLFDGDTGPMRLFAVVQHIDEYQSQIITSLEIERSDTRVKLEWEPADPPETARYTIDFEGKQYLGVNITFAGLLPSRLPRDESLIDLRRFLVRTAAAMQVEFPVIRYFGPFRDRPQRRYRLPARTPTDLGASGEYAAPALASDLARQGGQLLRQVNEFLQPELSGWKLNVIERAGQYAVVLTTQDDSFMVNLTDVGTGVAQVLPILVQRALDVVDPPKGPTLEIVEQPELHLHPAAHRGLADIYISAAQRSDTRFIVETHSETFLLRVRRRVAEGIVDPNILAVYFLENSKGIATVRPINIAADGSIDYWPTGIFSEDYEEARALAKAQSQRPNADAN